VLKERFDNFQKERFDNFRKERFDNFQKVVKSEDCQIWF